MTPLAREDSTSLPPSTPDPAEPSAPHSVYHHALASQVLHNLQYQHDWTSLRIHNHSPVDSSLLLPRLLLSGLPPHRVYVHPDEQVEMLTRGIREQDVAVEREWVLPTHLKEKWSLRRFAEVFDAVGKVPPDMGSQDAGTKIDQGNGVEEQGGVGSRRGGKRALLATVADDSTVVYYVVHDGIVKPRQN